MNKVNIELHGPQFDGIKKKFRMSVKSVSEAVHAINIMTRGAFYSRLLENDKEGIKYKILINENPALFSDLITEKNIHDILNSELVMKIDSLKTIDFVPVVEGADPNPLMSSIIGKDGTMIVAGVIVVAAGIALSVLGTPFIGVPLIFAGLGMIAVGVINLLSSPPKESDFASARRASSYLFDGPTNTVGEGGPVPIVYGQILVGSQTITQTYEITDKDANILITT